MHIIIKGTNIDLTPSIREYLNEKIGSISKVLSEKQDSLAEARVEVGRPSKHHRKGYVYLAEVNLSMGSELFRAEAKENDLHTAIDLARDEIKRQLGKFKTKLQSKRREHRLSQ